MTTGLQPANSRLSYPVKRMPKWATDYFEALHKTQGALLRAAQLIKLSYSATYKARNFYPEFDNKVDAIKREWDDLHLSELEDISMTQAKKPGNTIERFFQLKRLAPHKYRDQAPQNAPGNITIHFGVRIGNGPDTMTFTPDGKQVVPNGQEIDNDEPDGIQSLKPPTPPLLSDEECDV